MRRSGWLPLVIVSVIVGLPVLRTRTESMVRPQRVTQDLSQPGRLWGIAGQALYKSPDNGSTWQLVPLHQDITPEAVWAASGSVLLSAGSAGLLRSVDEGQTWLSANQGLKNSIGRDPAAVTDLATTSQAKILYVATAVDGVFRSDDGGARWHAASGDLPVPLEHRVGASLIAVDPADPSRVYTLLSIPEHSERVRHRLFGSANGGFTWGLLKEFPSEEIFEDISVEQSGTVTVSSSYGITEVADTIPDQQASGRLYGGRDLFSSPSANDSEAVFDPRLNVDVNDIAVLEDDGTLVFRRFDLAGKSVEFRPQTNGGYAVTVGNADMDPAIGDRFELGDDDSRRVQLNFPFTFYGQTRRTAFVNSNGSLSFDGPDRAPLGSTLTFFAGRPKIAALWEDLVPTRAASDGGVFVRILPNRLTVTWRNIPLFRQNTLNTVQLSIFPSGSLRIDYGTVASLEGIVGISGGGVLTGRSVSYSEDKVFTENTAIPIAQEFVIPEFDPLAVANRFYATHVDEFDAIIMFGASSYRDNLAGGGALAYHLRTQNSVQGVGISVGDATRFFGSRGKLQSVINMNGLSSYPNNIRQRFPGSDDDLISVLGQEWGHRFLAFVRFRDRTLGNSSLLGRSLSHWNYFFNSDASVLEGNRWTDLNNGSFSTVAAVERYSRLDQYLMGIRPAEDVPPLWYISSPGPLVSGTVGSIVSTFGLRNNAIRDPNRNFGAPNRYTGFVLTAGQSGLFGFFIARSGFTEAGLDPSSLTTPTEGLNELIRVGDPYQIRRTASSSPQAHYYNPDGTPSDEPLTFTGTRNNVTVDQIIDFEGERVPARGIAPTRFRQAFILVVPRGTRATAADLAKMATIQQEWAAFYRRATDNLSSISFALRE